MTKKRNHRRRTAVRRRPERDEVLRRLAFYFMEVGVSERVGKDFASSANSNDPLRASVVSWARSDEERHDLIAQAGEIAEETIDRAWPQIEPLALASGGNMRFRDLGTWPEPLLGVPLHPLPGSSNAEEQQPGLPRPAVRHRAAHGIVGTIMLGVPIAVGFSGFTLPGGYTDLDARMQTLLAGIVVDLEHSDPPRIGASPPDGCDEVGRMCLLRRLGVPTAVMASVTVQAARDQIMSLGREGEAMTYYKAQYAKASTLVDLACHSGFLDQQATAMEHEGRIVFDPGVAAAALGVSRA
jgi:hypothetical protein